MIDWSNFENKLQERGSTTEQVATHLYNEIQRYQASLPDTEDVAMMLV